MNTILSESSLLQRHSNGIKFIQPKLNEAPQLSNAHLSLSLADLFAMPFHVYIEDKQNIIVNLNHSCASVYGHETKDSALGKILTKMSSTDKRRMNNRELIKSSSAYGAFHETISSCDDRMIDIVSIKFIWLNDMGKPSGIIACDIEINLNIPNFIAEQINCLIKLFDNSSQLRTEFKTKKNDFQEHYTKREIEVIEWVLRGKTMREIADITGLSIRTVESYFDNIKKKADVTTKSQFIDKAIHYYSYV